MLPTSYNSRCASFIFSSAQRQEELSPINFRVLLFFPESAATPFESIADYGVRFIPITGKCPGMNGFAALLTTVPSGINSPAGVIPVSSINSRIAASRALSSESISPLGIDQYPLSLFLKNGPPGAREIPPERHCSRDTLVVLHLWRKLSSTVRSSFRKKYMA